MRPVQTLIRSALFSAALLAGSASQAALVTAVPGTIAAYTIGFSAYNGTTSAEVIDAAKDVGQDHGLESVLLDFSEPDAAHILGAVTLDLAGNGAWPFNGAYAGLNAVSGAMTFSFTRGMNFAGGFLNYHPNIDGSVIVEALDAMGDVLITESLDLTTVTGWGDGNGLFYGFHLDSADIWGLRLSSGNVVIDNLTFGTTAVVPEPAALTLVLVALAGLGWQRRGTRTSRG